MKVTLETYGGLAAGIRRQPTVIDTSVLGQPEAEELARLVSEAKSAPALSSDSGTFRDAMGYTITIEEDGGASTTLEASDGQMPESFARLLKFLRR